ncbi:chemotaxis protein CheV [Alcaligenaceae bacterium]|nr:chemotaxis protein CheV [Alcaligenaceae bacterium]
MENFQKDIEERTNLTSANKFEMLLFRLGSAPGEDRSELFGINVFKLSEIVPMMPLTKAVGMEPPLLGMINVRGKIIPVIDLPAVVGCQPRTGLNILLITEYARSIQAFAVESVDDIVRLDWNQVLTAETGVNGGYTMSLARLDADNMETSRLALILDVEQILCDFIPADRSGRVEEMKSKRFKLKPGAVAIVADDSKVARTLLEQGLNAMEIPFTMHVTGLEAWNKVKEIAKEARAENKPLSEKLGFVLTDLEMPEMDGFTLTRNIRSDEFLKNIPVIIHSSLSGNANEEHVGKVGADAYVAKFEVNELANAIQASLEKAKYY